jgi:hypothetical protein
VAGACVVTYASTVHAGRRMAESMMLDTCTVRRVTGEVTDDNGNVTPTYSAVYAGVCKVQTNEGVQTNPEVAGATATVQRYTVHVPVGAFEPAVGQVVNISAARLDPYLAGRSFRVVALLHKTAATAYRLAVEEVS